MRLDNTARMNFPGTIEGNWAWRVGDSKVWQSLQAEAKAMRSLAATFDRLPPGVQTIEPSVEAEAPGSNGCHSSNGSGPVKSASDSDVVKAVKGAVTHAKKTLKV